MRMVFCSSMVGINIFTHGWKGWMNPYGKIDRGHHGHIRMDIILVLRIYAGIGKIRLISQKTRLEEGLEFHIR